MGGPAGDFLRLGKHFICELSGCDRTIVFDNDRVRELFVQAASVCGLSVVGEGRFDYNPYGFTCYLLLAESHASIHVWPEHAYCAVDLFTCNLTIDTAPFFAALRESFGATQVSVRLIERGCLRG